MHGTLRGPALRARQPAPHYPPRHQEHHCRPGLPASGRAGRDHPRKGRSGHAGGRHLRRLPDARAKNPRPAKSRIERGGGRRPGAARRRHRVRPGKVHHPGQGPHNFRPGYTCRCEGAGNYRLRDTHGADPLRGTDRCLPRHPDPAGRHRLQRWHVKRRWSGARHLPSRPFPQRRFPADVPQYFKETPGTA